MSPNRLLLRIAQRYPMWMALTVILGLAGAIFNGVSTALIVPVLLSFLEQGVAVAGMPPMIQQLLAPFDRLPDEWRLLVMAGAIVLLLGLKNGASYANTLVSGALKRVLVTDLREEGLRLVLEVDLDFYSQTSLGDTVNRLNVELNRSVVAVTTAVRSATTVLTIAVFVGLLLALSWPLTLAAGLLLGGVTWLNQFGMARARQLGEQLSETSKVYSINLMDVLTGMRLVRATATERQEYARLRQLVRAREQAEFRSMASAAAIAPVSEITGVIALIGIVWLGRTFLATQLETLSTVLLTYLLLIFRLLPLLSQFNTARNQVANGMSSVLLTEAFLQRQDKPFMVNGDRLYTGLQQGIHLSQVSFHYRRQSQTVLTDVELYLPRGTTLALVGASGAGKSTLADLLPRFYDPTAGAILLDGIDLRAFDMRSLRRAMGIISQETILFNASVRDNIAYGVTDATDQEIWDAAKLANADEFITQLPHGINTPIGDRGVLLSGGQRQRLAIARALLQNPEILILDEATSALDTVSERLVQQALETLSRDRTTLVIAHRLSTVQKAEQIAVLDQGRVVELGTHEQLLKQGGYYTRLCAMQFADAAMPTEINIPHSPLTSPSTARRQVAQRSYEIRNRLNILIGSLRLMLDDMITDASERDELIEEAYDSTLSVLKSLEALEHEQETGID